MCTWVADDFEDNIGTVVCLLGEEVFVALGVGLVEWNGPVCFGELCESFKAMVSHLIFWSSSVLMLTQSVCDRVDRKYFRETLLRRHDSL